MNTTVNPAAVIGHNSAVTAAPKLTDAQMKAIASTMDKLADNLSALVTPEANTMVETIIQARKDWQGGPFKLLAFAKDTYGEEQLASFPTPGSEVGDCPDKYKIPYYRDGKLKFKATSFYAEFFKRTATGKAIEVALAFITLAKDEKANHTTVPADILNMNPVDLDRYKTTLEQERTVAIAAWRNAMALQKQFEAVNSLDHVEAAPLTDKDGVVIQAAKPIKVWNIDQPEKEWNLYSVGAFLMFDAAKASENGGTFEALKLTVKRDQQEGAGNETVPHIATNKTLSAMLRTVNEFITNKHIADKKRELYGLYLKDEVNGAGSADNIEAIYNIYIWAKAIVNIPAVKDRLDADDAGQKAAA